MKILRTLSVLFFSLFFFGCWSSEKAVESNKEEKIVAKNSNRAVSNVENNLNAESEKPEREEVAESPAKIETYEPSENEELSPTETLKAFNSASVKKDPEKIKSFISLGSIHLITQKAKDEGLSFDQMVKAGDGIPAFETTEIRGEEITGNTASVEIKFEDRDKFDSIPFIKENGKWKIDFDKFFKNVISETNS